MAEITTAEQITSILAEALNQPTQEAKKQMLQPLIKKLAQLRNRILYQEQHIDSYNATINKYRALGMSRNSAIAHLYKTSKYTVNLKYEEEVLQQILLEGYETVMLVREMLTNEQIHYQIGAGGKTTGKIMEVQTTLKELMPYLYMEYRSEGYSLRIKASQKMVREIYTQQQIEAGIVVDEIDRFVPTASSLYSAVYRYYKDERLTPKGNYGNMYETYRLLLAQSQHGNQWIPNTQQIANAFAIVLSNVGKEGSFSKGGDVLLEQDKAAIGSRPTLTNTVAVANALQELAYGLQDYIELDSVVGLQSALISSKTGVEVFDTAKEEAQNVLFDKLSVSQHTIKIDINLL